MNERDTLSFLQAIQVNIQRRTYSGSRERTRWMNISCPFAPYTHAGGTDHDPSFGIALNEDGRSYYKCLSCSIKGGLAGMATRLGGYRGVDYSKQRRLAEAIEVKATAERPVPDWEDIAPVDEQHHATERKIPSPFDRLVYNRLLRHSYLTRRGLHYPTPYQLDLRYDGRDKRILFPCYDTKHRFRGFTGRSIMPADAYSKRYPKVKDYYGLDKRTLFLGMADPPTRGPNLICEGLLDYAMLVQHGFPRTRAILGTSLTDEKLDILVAEQQPVYFFMDNDQAGWNALFGIWEVDKNGEEFHNTDNAWAYQLYKEVPVWIVPYRKHMAGEDPGSLSRAEVHKAVELAWLFTGEAPYRGKRTPTLCITH